MCSPQGGAAGRPELLATGGETTARGRRTSLLAGAVRGDWRQASAAASQASSLEAGTATGCESGTEPTLATVRLAAVSGPGGGVTVRLAAVISVKRAKRVVMPCRADFCPDAVISVKRVKSVVMTCRADFCPDAIISVKRVKSVVMPCRADFCPDAIISVKRVKSVVMPCRADFCPDAVISVKRVKSVVMTCRADFCPDAGNFRQIVRWT